MKFAIPILAVAIVLPNVPAKAAAPMKVPEATNVQPAPGTPAPTKAPAAAKPLEATLARDEKGGETGTSFSTADTKIYLIAKDPGGVKGDKLRVVWTAENTNHAFPNGKQMNDFTQTLTGPGQSATFFTQVASGFPAGQYRVDVYNNGTLVKSLKFTVKK